MPRMPVIHLNVEVFEHNKEFAVLFEQFSLSETVRGYMSDMPEYIAWREFLKDTSKECDDYAQAIANRESISSEITTIEFVRQGVPRERIIAMFKLIFNQYL